MYNEILGLVTFITTFAFMVLMYRFFGRQGLIAWVAISAIIADIQVIEIVEVFGTSAALGSAMLASIYLATDVLNDIYGHRVAKRVVRLGFSSTLIMIVVMQSSLHFIPAPKDMAQEVSHVIFGVVPRITLGPIVTYIIGQHVDVFIFSLIKKVFSSGEAFFIRAYDSTFLSSVIDTTIFVAIAFIGSLPNIVVFETFITTYVLKLASTIFNVPFGYTAKSFYREGKIDRLDQGY